MSRSELERRIHRELNALPLLRAPHTLLPRVLAAVQRLANRPWYERAWFTWPIGWQVASVVAFVAILGSGLYLWREVEPVVSRSVSFLPDLQVRVASLSQSIFAGVNAALVLWRTLVAPFVAFAMGVIVLMGLACVTAAMALSRLAPGRTAHP